jgi:hypothetical protein
MQNPVKRHCICSVPDYLKYDILIVVKLRRYGLPGILSLSMM